MAPSKMRRALGAVKDQTSIGLAKVGSSASLADLDVAIVKATRHEEQPAEEKHIREILSLTCYSRAFISACVNTLARRLNKTKNWTVALKTLVLIHRLLSDGDPAYEQEIFFSTRRGTRFLNMSDFRDSSSSSSWDYSAFVRTYALYLDERLEYRMQSRRGRRSAFGMDEDDDDQVAPTNQLAVCVRATPVREMKTEQVFSKVQHLLQLLDRFLACRPTGAAKVNRVIIVALYPSVRESFQMYYDLTEAIGILIDRFMEMEVPECVKVLDIFTRVGKQFDELDHFYSWCKTTGIARSSEYPEVEKITPKKLEVMDDFIREKSTMEKTRRQTSDDQEVKEEKEEEEEEQDMNAIKALPAPETLVVEEKKEKPEKEAITDTKPQQQEGDLLNLGEDYGLSSQDQADKLALALFDHVPQEPPQQQQPGWEAFSDKAAADWETALVQSATGLANQKTNLAGGFDMLLLDGMYRQAKTSMAIAGPGFGASGSASSVAVGSSGQPAMLALPAPPPTSDGIAVVPSNGNVDPFAASLGVAPPPYVQMSEMEKKQKLLVEEQLMWQQYARDGMQGQLGMGKIQHKSYNGGYTRTY
ncbi:putative clathrin assembly protein At1g03050 [Humulus lupulus]|uniref:putative clathrin assembly protein At1g03050 n=1 Tax=Humulus lupulus TaxID=3486 RepID=UPI002B4173A5|nr:putative clathrin assembly protein At1g03050 [Humulus lupulus]